MEGKLKSAYTKLIHCTWVISHFKKGKAKPLEILEKDPAGRFLQLFSSKVDGEVDINVPLEFVCKMYGQNREWNVDEARYEKLLQMSGKVVKVCYLSGAAKSNLTPFQLGIKCVAFTVFN